MADKTEGRVVEYHVLTPSSYHALLQKLPKLGVTNDPIHAGILIGIQMVLQELRDGFVSSK